MKNTIFLVLSFLCLNLSHAQTTTFDNLNANPLTGKAITWTSSNYGDGFGHRIINTDPGIFTVLNFQGRQNSTTWSDIMTMTTQGKVGFGISNPLSRVHISNGSSGNNPHIFSDLAIEDSNQTMLTLMTNNAKTAYYAFADTDDDFVGGMQYDHSQDLMTFRVNNHSVDLAITNNGNIGIGTSSPSGLLHITSGTSGDALLRIEADTDNNNESDNPIIEFSQDGDLVGASLGFSENFGENLFGIGTKYPGTGGLRWDTFIINPVDGFVGIGTTVPDSKLTVKGNIHTEEVKVDLSVPGPDYVFKEDYKLKSLEEVQNFINEHGHLPNIPSAKEMETNGIQLGEMNMKLLEKIEELTLYILEKDREIRQLDSLKVRVAKQESRLKELEKLLQSQ